MRRAMGEDARLLTVGEIADLTVLGVHAAPGGVQAGYVRRDRHADIVAALRPGAVVLVTGPAGAGTSRAAFEAVAAALPDHTLVIPRDRASVGDAVAVMAAHPRSVLWLDLDVFLGAEGLAEMLDRVLDRGDGPRTHRVVVATMTSTWPRPGPPVWGAAGVLRRFPRAALGLLDRARCVHLDRGFSPGELQRAREKAGDRVLGAALRHPAMGPSGARELAAVLAGAPDQLAAWHNAAAGANRCGAALVTAAVHCRRIGLHAAPRVLLQTLAEQHLHRTGAVRATAAATVAWEWALGWEWALATATLREVQHSGYRVSGYLFEQAATEEAPVPNATLRAALDHADAAETALIAATAHQQGQLVLAETGYRRAHHGFATRVGQEAPVSLEVAHDLAVLLADRGQIDQALAGLLRVLITQQRVLGPHHAATLATMHNLAAVQCASAPSDSALARSERTVCSHDTALGTAHPATLACRLNLGIALAQLQRLPDAAGEFWRVAQHSQAQLGPEHPVTLAARHQLALVLGAQRLWGAAHAERDAVLAEQRRVLGNDHPATLTSRHERASLLRMCGRLADAAAELNEVLLTRTRVLGTVHPATVTSRGLLAEIRLERADNEHADGEPTDGEHEDRDDLVAELRAVLALQSGLHGPDHPNTLQTRHTLGRLHWDRGDLDSAATDLAAVVAGRTRVLDADTPLALMARHDLAVLTAQRGDLELAIVELAALTEDCARVMGPEHPMTVTARDDHAMVQAAANTGFADTGSDGAEPFDVEDCQRRAVELYQRGDFDAADPLLRAVLSHRDRTLGAEHPLTLACAHNVAMVLHNRGLRAEAATLHRAVLTARGNILGQNDPATLASQHDLAIVLWELGDGAGAAAGFETALAGRARVLGTDHPATAISRNNLDVVLAQLIPDGDNPAPSSISATH